MNGRFTVALMGATLFASFVALATPPAFAVNDSDNSDSTIVWARGGDIDTLNPQQATSTLSRQLWYQIYDSLLEFNEKGEVVPNLAKKWKVTDGGKVVTFYLHDNIRCSDGTPFTAKDVKWTADRALSTKHPSVTKASWGPITKVQIVNKYTVSFHLSHPFAAFVPFMADQFSSMLCDSNADASGFGTTSAIGTGPWKFVGWKKGSKITLERNPHYHNYGRPVKNPGPPHIEHLIISTIPSPQTRVAALRTGSVDMIVPPIPLVKQLKQNPKFRLYIGEKTGQNMFLEFAVHRPPFDDVRGRKAIAYAVNMKQAIKLVYGDLVQREYCPVGPGILGNDPALCKKYTLSHDPDKAEALVKQLGYGPDNPMKVVLGTWYGDNRKQMLVILEHQLNQIKGIKASIEVMDIGTLNARVRTENTKKNGPGWVDLMGWTWYDPDVLYLLWHSPGAYRGYTSEQLDKLLEDTRTTLDHDKRVAAVHKVFKNLLSNAVMVPAYTPAWNWLYVGGPKTKGFSLSPYNRPQFSDIGE